MTRLILIKQDYTLRNQLVSTNLEYNQYTCLIRIGGVQTKQSGSGKVDKQKLVKIQRHKLKQNMNRHLITHMDQTEMKKASKTHLKS